MKQLLLSVMLSAACAVGKAQVPILDWSVQFGGTTSDVSRSTCIDGVGNIYTAGHFRETGYFGNDTISTSGGGADYNTFITKQAADGSLLWTKVFTGSSNRPASIACNEIGEVLVGGDFTGTTDFDPDTSLEHFITAIGTWDAYVIKLDTNGSFVFADRFGSAWFERVRALALTSQGDVLVTGQFAGTTDFDPDPLDQVLLSAVGPWTCFIVKLDPLGELAWARSVGENSFGLGIAALSNGNVVTCGHYGLYTDSADFDPGAGEFYLQNQSSGAMDAFISILDPSGNFVHAIGIGGVDNDYFNDLVVSAMTR